MTKSEVGQNRPAFEWKRPSGGFRLAHAEEGFHVLGSPTDAEEAAARRAISESGSSAAKAWFNKQLVFTPYSATLESEGPWIVLHECAPAGAEDWESYDVNADATLFRQFAGLEGDLAGSVSFANRYGFLFGGTCDVLRGHAPGSALSAEPCFLWSHEAWKMRTAVDLWQLLGAGSCSPDLVSLKRAIRWEKDGEHVRYFSPKERNLTGASEVGFPIHAQTQWEGKFDVVAPARALLEDLVNRALKANVAPIRLGTGQLLSLPPLNLLGALWMQFYWAMAGQVIVKGCLYCGALFEARAQRDLYCKARRDSCKTRASQLRGEVRGGAPIELAAERRGIPLERAIRIMNSPVRRG